MNFRIKSLVLLFFLIHSNVSAQQDFYPFLGKVTEKSVHIRAGQSKNFESLGRVNLDEQVVVTDKSYSWYKIHLPKQALSYISQEFVKLINSEVGEITSDRVNIRAGAGINFTVLGQLNKGDRVIILDQPEGWYKIQPIKDSYGWISENFIQFVSKDVSGYSFLENDKRLNEAIPDEISVEITEVDVAVPIESTEAPQTSFQGLLTANNSKETDKYQYLLTNDSNGTYYLDGFSQLLNPFINYKVKIEGYIKDVQPDVYIHPVIVVTRIQLIL